jgi:hypothetical protein
LATKCRSRSQERTLYLVEISVKKFSGKIQTEERQEAFTAESAEKNPEFTEKNQEPVISVFSAFALGDLCGKSFNFSSLKQTFQNIPRYQRIRAGPQKR